jgi:hypothetical protein
MHQVVRMVAILAVVAGAFLGGRLSASESVTMDGSWWQGLDPSAKIAAAQGILAGYDGGYWWCRDRYEESAIYQKAMKANGVAWARLEGDLDGREQLRNFRLTFGTIVDRINSVYRDYPEVQKAEVSTFATCATTVGMDCSSTAREVSKNPRHRD